MACVIMVVLMIVFNASQLFDILKSNKNFSYINNKFVKKVVKKDYLILLNVLKLRQRRNLFLLQKIFLSVVGQFLLPLYYLEVI